MPRVDKIRFLYTSVLNHASILKCAFNSMLKKRGRSISAIIWKTVHTKTNLPVGTIRSVWSESNRKTSI